MENVPNLDLDVVNTPKYIILDTDMGTDDYWALLMLLKAEKHFSNIKLLAITCVHGNTTIDNVIQNAFVLLDILGRTDVSCIIYSHPFIESLNNICFAFLRFRFTEAHRKL